MHRFFYKIFLWFWLGIVVVGATLVILTASAHSRASEDEHWRLKYGARVDLWARQESEILDREGSVSLEKYVNSFESEPGVRNYLFDARGREVFSRQAPAQVLSAVASMDEVSQANAQFFTSERIIAEKVMGPSGGDYVVVVSFPQPSVLRRPLFQFLADDIGKAGIIRLGVVLLVAGLFCFWLARQITNPIGKLRLATREIANEHLDARVDKNVLARRDEIADLGRDFDRMAVRIDDLVAAQRRLLADVSHTLRSPLARLNVALGLAWQDVGPETAKHLERIERESDYLNRLISQLLTMARVDSGVDLQHKRVFDLVTLVQEVAADGNFEARDRNCVVKFTPAGEYLIEGEPEMLRGAVENVVRNAVKHTRVGTDVEISLACGQVGEKPQAVIQVRDHGAGVPTSELENICRRFHRVAGGISDYEAGTGLGLAITECAFRLHGGRVSAANAPGGGLLVSLELPIVSSKALSSTTAQRRIDGGEAQSSVHTVTHAG